MIYLGTAGWNIPREASALFPSEGSHLERYAARLNAVEINSSFYKPHRPGTYVRWAATVPEHFRFSVKLPREITHQKRFVDVDGELDRFFSEATSLGNKLGPILIQLPPSFAFEAPLARAFFISVRARFSGQLAFEPRHPTWFESVPESLLREFDVARVRADPPPVPEAAVPGGSDTFRYHRLHGSPRVYYSAYENEFLAGIAAELGGTERSVWCILDNTALGFAAQDALKIATLLGLSYPG